MAILDMGAEFHFYGSDITCSFPDIRSSPLDSQSLLVRLTTRNLYTQPMWMLTIHGI
ncbi:hypothetical protein HanIR_Chr17g0865041 [Helianthus annuus]|nr:hypothetical protein HanIR_Chr17g0865041 [Helianthus annuus]